MTYSSLMVHLDLDQPNDARLHVAGDLAEQFDAKLIGIAAASPSPRFTPTVRLPKVLSKSFEAEAEEKLDFVGAALHDRIPKPDQRR